MQRCVKTTYVVLCRVVQWIGASKLPLLGQGQSCVAQLRQVKTTSVKSCEAQSRLGLSKLLETTSVKQCRVMGCTAASKYVKTTSAMYSYVTSCMAVSKLPVRGNAVSSIAGICQNYLCEASYGEDKHRNDMGRRNYLGSVAQSVVPSRGAASI